MKNLISLNGKRVIFIGNSYVFYGNAVIRKGCDVLTEQERSGDKGYFYQLAKSVGEEVFVTNWTFGGHALFHLFGGVACAMEKECKGVMHADYLGNTAYDYVVVSPSSGRVSEENIISDFEKIEAFFQKKNPDVKLVCLGNLGAHGYSSGGLDHPGIYNSYEALRARGVIIADWGGFVMRLLSGELTIPDFTLNKDSFIVNRTEKDGFHPNPLSGYITALYLYSVLTGRSAVGMDYSFALDSKIAKEFDTDSYVKEKYANNGGKTNYHEILASKRAMLAIQELIDANISSQK